MSHISLMLQVSHNVSICWSLTLFKSLWTHQSLILKTKFVLCQPLVSHTLSVFLPSVCRMWSPPPVCGICSPPWHTPQMNEYLYRNSLRLIQPKKSDKTSINLIHWFIDQPMIKDLILFCQLLTV